MYKTQVNPFKKGKFAIFYELLIKIHHLNIKLHHKFTMGKIRFQF